MNDYTIIAVDEIEHETDAAFLIRVGDHTLWVPKSQVDDDSLYHKGDEDVDMEIQAWFCKKEGIE
jgi:hypothetical protein